MIVFTPVGSSFFALKYTKKDSTLYYYYLTLTGCFFCLFVCLFVCCSWSLLFLLIYVIFCY